MRKFSPQGTFIAVSTEDAVFLLKGSHLFNNYPHVVFTSTGQSVSQVSLLSSPKCTVFFHMCVLSFPVNLGKQNHICLCYKQFGLETHPPNKLVHYFKFILPRIFRPWVECSLEL